MRISCNDCGAVATSPTDWHVYLKKQSDGTEKVVGYKCPACHRKNPAFQRRCEIYSRVTGYLRPVSQWNRGKQAEFRERKTYKA